MAIYSAFPLTALPAALTALASYFCSVILNNVNYFQTYGYSRLCLRLAGDGVGGVFTRQNANEAYKALLGLGHTEDDISLLLSDETLNKNANPVNNDNVSDPDTSSDGPEDEPEQTTRHGLADAIISITSLISLPDLGIWISRKLTGHVAPHTVESTTKEENIGSLLATKIPEEHCQTYHTGMMEGGIIISVDPRNRAERDAIVRAFKSNDGHDILGDDGYTELDNAHHLPR